MQADGDEGSTLNSNIAAVDDREFFFFFFFSHFIVCWGGPYVGPYFCT
jgi:hypothetical protein